MLFGLSGVTLSNSITMTTPCAGKEEIFRSKVCYIFVITKVENSWSRLILASTQRSPPCKNQWGTYARMSAEHTYIEILINHS